MNSNVTRGFLLNEHQHNDFWLNLTFAQEIEKKAALALRYHLNGLTIGTYNNDKGYDFCCHYKGKTSLVEVKEDRATKKWHNCTIEYKSRNVLSGITTSIAPLWVYIVHCDKNTRHFMLFTLAELRRIRDENLYKHTKHMENTDSNNDVYLIEYDEFVKYKHISMGYVDVDIYDKDWGVDYTPEKTDFKKSWTS